MVTVLAIWLTGTVLMFFPALIEFDEVKEGFAFAVLWPVFTVIFLMKGSKQVFRRLWAD